MSIYQTPELLNMSYGYVFHEAYWGKGYAKESVFEEECVFLEI